MAGQYSLTSSTYLIQLLQSNHTHLLKQGEWVLASQLSVPYYYVRYCARDYFFATAWL